MGWLAIVGNLFGIGKDALVGWQDRKKIKLEQDLRVETAKVEATIDRIKSGDDHAAGLDMESVKQRGWKDEYLLLLTTTPLLLLFVGPLIGVDFQTPVKDGFIALKETPEYYWYALAIVYVDTFGFRRMLRVAFENWINSKFGGQK